MGQKEQTIRDLTENVISLLVQYEAEVSSGDMSLSEAQQRSKNRIRKLRYGPEGKDYFWINDMQPKMVMHPYRPELEGQDLRNITDSNGTKLFVEFVETVRENDAGYVDYEWQWKDDPDRVLPKISYVSGFKPWGWIVGTGIYVGDVQQEIAGVTRRMVVISSVILVLALLFSLYIIIETVKAEQYRVASDQKLQESEEMFRTLCEDAPFGISITDSKHCFEYLNPKFTEIFGYSIDDIPEKETWFKQAYPDENYRKKVRSTWENDQNREASKQLSVARVFKVRCKNRNQKIIRFRVVPLENERQFLTYEDITEQSRMEAALRESEKKFMSLYEESRKALEIYRSFLLSSADAIVLYDMEGNAQYVNRAFTDIFGWTAEEVLESRVPFLPDSERDKSMAIISDIVENGTPYHNYVTKRYCKDGRMLDVSISASRYEDFEGKPMGLFVILRDISEKKVLEMQFHEAQKMESIGTLAGGIAHDFNNLLMAVQGNLTMILLNEEVDSNTRDRISKIEQYIKKGAELTRQLLGFARGGKYEAKPTNMNELIVRSADMFTRARKEIQIHFGLAEELWTVEADQGQLDQVLLNLFVNAAQAMPEGGDIFVHSENIHVTSRKSKQLNVEAGRYVKVSVADAGVGMDESTCKRIFEPFFTTRDVGEGTGLGLASAYGILRNHGGAIYARSEPDWWTTVSFLIPALAGSALNDFPEDKPLEEIEVGNETILLVDDEPMIIEVGSQLLEQLGYRVYTAEGGKEAIEVYRQYKDTIDLVILDMIMPDMNGAECFEQIREIKPSVKVLLSSGYSIDGQATEILKRGCNGFIQKPFNLIQMSRKIREILDRTIS